MQSFPSSVRAFVFLAGLVSVALPSVGRADTVYLKNGAYIDGIVTARSELLLTITIGEIGKLEVSMDDVLRVEKNSRGGWRAYVPVDQRELPDVVQKKNAGRGEVDEDGADGEGDEGEGGDDPDDPGSSPDGGSSDSAEDGDDGDGDEGEGDEKEEDIDPELKAKIEKLIYDLQRQKTKHRRRAERKLRRIGAPAVPFLLPLVTRGGDLTRITALRLVSEHAAERDPEVVEVCLKALSDDNYFVRDYGVKTLRRLTGQEFGFDPRAGTRTRRRAVLKWESWWEKEKEKPEDDGADVEGEDEDDEREGEGHEEEEDDEGDERSVENDEE